MRKGDVFMKKSVGKNELILLLAVLMCTVFALSSCADPYGKTGYNEKGRVGNDPKVSDSETKPPMPTDGVIGYWVTPQGNDAIYFDKDGTCIMYETFSADLYEEYWVYQWSYLNEDNIRFEAEIDGELLFEDEKFEIVGNVLHMYDDTTFVYYKESKPEICYYDIFYITRIQSDIHTGIATVRTRIYMYTFPTRTYVSFPCTKINFSMLPMNMC